MDASSSLRELLSSSLSIRAAVLHVFGCWTLWRLLALTHVANVPADVDFFMPLFGAPPSWELVKCSPTIKTFFLLRRIGPLIHIVEGDGSFSI